jgi:hypothetical protein
VKRQEIAGDPQRREVDDRLVADAVEQGALGLEARDALEPAGQWPFVGLVPLAEAVVHRLEGRVVHPNADLDERHEQAAGRELDRPQDVASVDVRRSRAGDSLGAPLENLAPLDSDRRLGEEAGDLVAEAQRASAGPHCRHERALRSRTAPLTSKRSAKSAPHSSRSSKPIDSAVVLNTESCSRAPLPTCRSRRTARLLARRPGKSGFVRKKAAE